MKKINQQIQNYLKYCEYTRRMSPVTLEIKRYTLARFVTSTGIKDLRKLTNAVFDGWVEHEVRRRVSPRSLNTYNAVVLAMVRYFTDSGLKIPLQISLIKKAKVGRPERKFYALVDVERVISGCDFETGLMVRLMFETGMRIAELARLKVTDFDGARVRFIGKGQKLREVYLGADTYRLVHNYVSSFGVGGYLWGANALNGEPPTINTIRKRLKEAFTRAGYEGFYPHALRHSFATNLQLRGASVAEIKEMIGHSSIATTERYLHGFDGRLEELFEKYR